jgi:hypothetical protein
MVLDELSTCKDSLELAIEEDITKRIKAFKEETGCDISDISISMRRYKEFGWKGALNIVQNVTVELTYKELTIR